MEKEYISKYQNVNIGGEPVARMPIVMGVFVAISGLCFILNILLVKSDRINKRKEFISTDFYQNFKDDLEKYGLSYSVDKSFCIKYKFNFIRCIIT